MARRKQSAFEDLIEITSKLSWWIGVVLAVVVYFVLHQFAVMEIVAPTGAKGVGVFAGKQLYKSLAIFGQYVLPAAFLFGALISVFSRRKRNALHAQVATAGKRSALEDMSWQEFEQLVGEYFRRKGFTVEETGGGGADGGIDLMVNLGKDRYLVQCKQWKARQIGVATVRELYGVMAAQGAAGGFVVTSGAFTDEARRFAEGREIVIITGDQLLQKIQATQIPVSAAKSKVSSTSAPDSKVAPACPQCGSTMIMKTARKGANVGGSFWGCSTFPKCRGTRPA
ncbi:MAG: restriction endonuclease [Burkholderiales bacterium]|nr:restriction endonuclease [Burkholderiales bacterium]